MIKVQHIGKNFGRIKAVDDVTFEVKEHEVLVLLGTSGCGKTTMLKMINRLVKPTKGEIFINGQSILDQPLETLRRKIGYVLQNNGLFPHYTIQQNIGIVPALLGWDKKAINERTAQLMAKLHLPDNLLTAYPSELSGGQQQRVGLARALAADPPILLMDEPFGALDSITRRKIHHEFAELDELKKKTIIMVTHDIQEAFELGDHICLMDKGLIVQEGSPAELLFSPKNAFVEAFLKEQRLQLEFKAFRLADILHLLPLSPNLNKDQSIELTADLSIWQALEALTNVHAKSANILDPSVEKMRSADFTTLVAGFYNYSNRRPHE